MIKYKIIDNFLNEEDFKNLSSMDIGNISKNEIKISHNKIFRNGNIQNGCLMSEDIKKLFELS